MATVITASRPHRRRTTDYSVVITRWRLAMRPNNSSNTALILITRWLFVTSTTSAVCSRLLVAFCRRRWRDKSCVRGCGQTSKCLFFVWDLDPHLTDDSMGSHEFVLEPTHDRFRRFCTARRCFQRTHADRATLLHLALHTALATRP